MSARAPNTIELIGAARAEGLEAILVGGNAVNLYAYSRTTFDIDLLIREEDRKAWIGFFEERGFTVFHTTANFTRMRFAADPAAAFPVDLMLADKHTFKLLWQKSRKREITSGLDVAIPDPLHLIAMKLHALRSPHRVERGVDFEDVRHLIRSEKIDITSAEFRDILDRYASEETRARIQSEIGSG